MNKSLISSVTLATMLRSSDILPVAFAVENMANATETVIRHQGLGYLP